MRAASTGIDSTTFGAAATTGIGTLCVGRCSLGRRAERRMCERALSQNAGTRKSPHSMLPSRVWCPGGSVTALMVAMTIHAVGDVSVFVVVVALYGLKRLFVLVVSNHLGALSRSLWCGGIKSFRSFLTFVFAGLCPRNFCSGVPKFKTEVSAINFRSVVRGFPLPFLFFLRIPPI